MKEITDIALIQKRLNDILCYFADVCEKHGLRYYLSNGTLLGARKYQGFIPWDDDLDVVMPREDYDKLMTLDCVDNEKFCLISRERRSNFRLPFAKLCDKNTLLRETTADFGCEIGLFMDIFPLDCWKSSKRAAERQASRSGRLRRFMSAACETEFYSPRQDWRRPILYLIWKYSRFLGIDFFRKRVENMAKKKRSSEYKGCVVWTAYGKREVLRSSLWNPFGTVIFEGREYPTFKGCEMYLHQLYGDYANDPPPERQKTHHTFHIFEKQDEMQI